MYVIDREGKEIKKMYVIDRYVHEDISAVNVVKNPCT